MENTLIQYFKCRWIDLDWKDYYKVYAFVVNGRDSFIYVGVLAENMAGIKKCVYYIKGPTKNKFIDLYCLNKDLLINSGFLVFSFTTSHSNTLEIVYLPSKQPFCTFNTNGKSSYKGNIFPKIENFRFCVNKLENIDNLDYGQEEIEQVHTSLMGGITDNIKVTNCRRLETLEEGTELLVTAILPICYRNKTKYILEFENTQGKYVSNYWLEQELEDIDKNYKIKIKCDKLKTTPSKHMERLVFCV